MPRRPWVPPPKREVPQYRPPPSGTRYFTHYWANDTWADESIQEGEPFRHAASNLFRSRGVASGDFVYVVTVLEGRLFLAGRIEVDRVLGQEEAEAVVGQKPLWHAEDHVVAKPGSERPARFDREVPLEVVKRLRFIAGDGPAVAPIFDSNGMLDPQTMRGVRELTVSSSSELDRLMG